MALNRTRARELLQKFDFASLFVQEMGWNSVPDSRPLPIGDTGYMRRLISHVSGVAVLEVFPAAPNETLPNRETSDKVHRQIEQLAHENVIIFLDDDGDRAKSMMYWVKREDGKRRPRRHHYFKGQPGDLFMSKIDGMVIEMVELREDGSLPISEVTSRLAAALDIERVTKRFYSEFSGLRVDFINLIQGIPREADRNWYASVLLNRLMFIYFLQKKGFIQENGNYLENKLEESQARGRDRYYSEFLDALFFEGFAKPAHERSPETRRLLGAIPYLNGGLFIRHRLELDYGAIQIPDRAFENVLRLFGNYSWHLDDSLGASDNEINPDVLGYIFEKYINQKAYGAYYTRGEITEYLCQRSIHSVILEKVKAHSGRQFDDLSDLLTRLDADLCRLLLNVILHKLSILDPACGSGAFLVAAMNNLLNIYGAVFGAIDRLNDSNLRRQAEKIRREHPSINYYMRKQIIVNNLYGVDIMDEATEIAKLRLFLALVSVAHETDDLEPLPNIDFNIMAGNSLIGLLNVDEKRFDDKKQMHYMFQDEMSASYRRVLDEKNRLIKLYRDTGALLAPTPNPSRHLYGGHPKMREGLTSPLQELRGRINAQRHDAQSLLNEILLDDFRALKIQYEGAQLKGRAKKRPLQTADIEALNPFHWGYEFDEIIETRGGFDVIITNPPWEVFQTDEKEFFQQFDPLIQKKKLRITDWKKQRKQLLEDPEIAQAWLEYVSGFPHVSRYIKTSPQYKNQISRMDGKIVSRKINLYAVFTEQCFRLLRDGGSCGIVIPSGIYSDLGTKQLRQMLFEETKVTGLFGFENRKAIFEGVHKSFKFVVLSFIKIELRRGGSFPASFMRHDVKELADFPADDSVKVSVDLIKRSSPSSLSVTEFKSALDIEIVEKMLRFPLLGEQLSERWNVRFRQELNMTSDSNLFHEAPGAGRLPLYEGKMIWQFQHGYAAPRYWIDEAAGRQRVLGRKGVDYGQRLDYQMYRLGFRAIASSTNERTMIMTMIPPNVFCNHMLPVEKRGDQHLPNEVRLLLCSLMTSYVVDYYLRQQMTMYLAFFNLYQTPVPRLMPGDRFFDAIARRAAQLICTAPEYDDLAAEVGLGGHHKGVINLLERARLRAELDGIIAHIYGLSEAEFAHVLGTFPLVDAGVKAAALEAYRAVARGAVM